MWEYSSGIISIEDSVKVNARSVIKYILTKLPSNSVNILCVEKLPDKWKHIFDGDVNCVFQESPKDWLSFKNIISCKANSTVILDSVNQLSAIIGWNEFLLFIDGLNKNKLVKNLILILHHDCLVYGNKMTNYLRYISQTYILLSPSPSGTRFLDVKTKLPGGKIKQFVEEVYYNSYLDKWVNNKIHKTKLNIVKEKTSMPEDVASFKILTEGPAKAVKDGMVLPYTELRTRESKVVYQHDAADDWDDEDPDEDLDI